VHALVLAGGEGTRLAAGKRGGGDRAVPKPLVEVAGRPLVVGLLETLARLGCETLTCMIREDFRDALRLLAACDLGRPLRVEPCHTPTSAHTLAAGLALVPPGPVFCSLVDTIMPPASWQTVYAATEAYLTGGVDAVLAVTPFVDDEAPLYVTRDPSGFVRALGRGAAGPPSPPPPPVVTGGVYGFNSSARLAAAEAVRDGVERMRGFLQRLVAQGARIATVEVEKIIDLDRPSDLLEANRWLNAAGL
jgi:NDP-sugar pyrophosphorylase family protein